MPHQSPGAERGEGGEAPERHAGHPGGDRDQVPDDRQQPPDERADLAVPAEERFRPVERAPGDQDELAEAPKHRLAHQHGERVVHERSDHASERAGGHGEPRVHVALGRQIAGRRHDGSLGSGSTDDSIAISTTMPG